MIKLLIITYASNSQTLTPKETEIRAKGGYDPTVLFKRSITLGVMTDV